MMFISSIHAFGMDLVISPPPDNAGTQYSNPKDSKALAFSCVSRCIYVKAVCRCIWMHDKLTPAMTLACRHKLICAFVSFVKACPPPVSSNPIELLPCCHGYMGGTSLYNSRKSEEELNGR